MTQEQGTDQHSWNGVQAYTLAAICLLIGVVIGYLIHAPARSNPSANSPVLAQQILSSATAERVPLTPNQERSIADQQAEPLLSSLQKHPKDAPLLEKVGAIYFRAHQFQVAQEYYSQSAAINSKDPAILVKLSSAYYYGGEGDKAISTLNHALDIDPGNADALFNVGVLQWQVNGNPQAAIASWQKLLKVHPEHPHRAQVEQMIARAKMHMNIAASDSDRKPTP